MTSTDLTVTSKGLSDFDGCESDFRGFESEFATDLRVTSADSTRA